MRRQWLIAVGQHRQSQLCDVDHDSIKSRRRPRGKAVGKFDLRHDAPLVRNGKAGPSSGLSALLERQLIVHVGCKRSVGFRCAIALRAADSDECRCRNPADPFIAMLITAGPQAHDRQFIRVSPLHPVKMAKQNADSAPAGWRCGRECEKLSRFAVL